MENRAQSQSIHTVRSAWNSYARISRGIMKVLLAGLGCWALVGMIGCIVKDDKASGSMVASKQNSIAVTALSVKHPEKFRYFFVIKNVSQESLSDVSTKISLETKAGKIITSWTFLAAEPSAPITPNQTRNIFMDANTGPASIHGEDAGIYQFTARSFDKTGDLSVTTGTISQEVIE